MKKFLPCALLFFAPLVFSQTKITPPNMALGHWVTTTDVSGIIEQTLASMPEDSRALVRAMMEEQMKDSSTTEQCVTKEMLENFDQQIKEAFAADSDCELDVIESNSTKFISTIECPGSVMEITTLVITEKRNETTLVTNIVGQSESEITSVSEWQSSTCPAGL